MSNIVNPRKSFSINQIFEYKRRFILNKVIIYLLSQNLFFIESNCFEIMMINKKMIHRYDIQRKEIFI